MTPHGTRLILLITDDSAQARLIGAAASRANSRVLIANDAESGLAQLGTRDGMALDAVVLQHSCEIDNVIGEIRARRPALPILLLADNFTHALSALRDGADDYILKPSAPERLITALEKLYGQNCASGELQPLSEKLPAKLGFGEIVGSAPAFRSALAIAAKAARARVSVLIEGECGVGKGTIAAALHAASPRDKKPFIAFDCAALPANQIESELFGHEKGAFTGAFARQIGKLRAGDGGSLLLCNVDALPPEAQVKLLRLMAHGEVQPMGLVSALHVDVRLITTSTIKLIDAVKAGRFREDLYAKLNTVHVSIPPLRERHGDVPALVRHLLARIAALPDMRGIGVTDAAMELLNAYRWSGNVGQLQSVLLRAALRCEGDALTVADFPNITALARLQASSRPHHADNAGGSAGGVTLFTPDGHMRSLEAIEADVIRLAIGHYRGRMTEVARRLGIGRSTLYRKLVELGLTDVA